MTATTATRPKPGTAPVLALSALALIAAESACLALLERATPARTLATAGTIFDSPGGLRSLEVGVASVAALSPHIQLVRRVR